jgi:hypothetical protein
MENLLYDTDFYGWVNQQVQLLRSGKLTEVDMDNLAEEIEDMGKNLLRVLESRLEILLIHLLKWQYQPSHRGKSWQVTIVEQRLALAKHLRKNPSLKPKVPNAITESYADAVIRASVETGLPKKTFPATCPYSFEEVMDENFWPES